MIVRLEIVSYLSSLLVGGFLCLLMVLYGAPDNEAQELVWFFLAFGAWLLCLSSILNGKRLPDEQYSEKAETSKVGEDEGSRLLPNRDRSA